MGSLQNADTPSKSFSRLVKAAGVTPITLHGLRHTHTSHLLMDGVHLKVVSERAGHANVTLGVYAAFTPTMQGEGCQNGGRLARLRARNRPHSRYRCESGGDTAPNSAS